MPSTFSTTLLAAGFGWVSGMRSASAPALFSLGLRRPAWRYRRPARVLARVPHLLALAAAGEMIVDKLPFIPARTSAPAISGRIASGALVGAAVAARQRKGLVAGAIAGAVGATASSFVMQHARAFVGKKLGVPDFPVAIAEDVLTIGLGNALARAVR